MKNELLKYKLLFTSLLLIISSILIVLYIQSIRQEYKTIEKLALEQARASFNKDLVYRRWSAQHGGVYVPLSDSLKPNPYLEVEEREITSINGKTYTLINPAYMTRMVHELAKEQYKIKGHITSLKAINPKNKPDKWEREVLKKFELGLHDYYSIENEEGKNHLRYMGVMIAEKSCLKCHGYQGYKAGDVRGGISVSVPLTEYELIYNENINYHTFFFVGVFILLIFLLFIVYRYISKEAKKRTALQLEELNHAKRHRWILQSALNGFLITDKQGKILETNEAYAKMTGFSESELLKMKISDLEFIEGEKDIKNHIKKLEEEGKDRFQTIHKKKDGSLINIDVSALIEPGASERIVCFLDDITERKKVESELQKNERQYRLLFENINEAFALHKVLKNNQGEVVDYEFIDVNPKFEELTGLKKEKLIGKRVLEVMPGTEKYWIDRYGKVVLTGQLVEFSNYSHELNKHYHVKAYSTEKEYFAVTFSDITFQKEAEKALRESEKRYRMIIEGANDAIFIADIDTGKIIDVNVKAEILLGQERNEIIGLHQSELHPIEAKQLIEESFRKNAAANRPTMLETYVQNISGETIPVEISPAKVTFDDDREYLIGFFRDIRERKDAEAELIAALQKADENDEKHRFLFENMTQGVVYHNAKGEVIYANNAAGEILGLTIDQLKGKTSMDPRWHSICEDGTDYPGEKHPAMLTLNTGKAIKNERMGVYILKERVYRWININSIPIFKEDTKNVTQVLVTFEDISTIINTRNELKQAVEKLKESEIRFKALHNASFGGIAIHDKGVILEVNQGMADMMGYSIEELIGMNGLLLIAEYHRDRVMHNIQNAYEMPYEADGLRKNGETFPMRLEAREVPYKGKNVRTVEFRDITQQKKYEKELERHQTQLEILVKERTDELEASNEELKVTNEKLYKQRDELKLALKRLNEAQAQLIQSEKMASLGVLVAGVAHEINNPVNFISSSLAGLKSNLSYLLSFTNLYQQLSEDNISVLKEIRDMQKEVDLSLVLEMFKRSIEIIEVGTERTVKIVKSLKSFARSDEKELGRYNVVENINNTLLILYHQYKNRIEIKKEYEEIPKIICYPGQINQVIMNLLTNAIQAIENKGVIIIKTKAEGNSNISISVQDSGIGISDKEINHIFDPFYTTKEVGKGTGLGLSISYNIIKEHKGEIKVSSQPGKGSCFTIILPVKQN